MPPGYVKLDATKWLDDCTNCSVKVRRRWDRFTFTKGLAQNVTRLGLHALPMPGRACLEAMFQFTIDITDCNDGHVTLWKFSDSYVMRDRTGRNVAADAPPDPAGPCGSPGG